MILFVALWSLSLTMKDEAESVWEQGAKKNIWTQKELGNRGVDKTT